MTALTPDGTSVLRGRGGDDVLRGARAGLVDCAGGDDEVHGVTRRVLLTRDCERLNDGNRFFEVTPYPHPTRTALVFAFYTDVLAGTR